MKKPLFFVLIAFFLPTFAIGATVTCTRITSDLSRGLSGASVTSLQIFLRDSGYLTATPNGYFGPATMSAVRTFQSAHDIPMTGTVGPLTRRMIEDKSCVSNTSQTKPTTTATTTANTSPRSNITITAPWEKNTLTIGSSYTIRWGGTMSVSDALVLEDESGTTRGYIAFFPGTGEEYVWDVGRVSIADRTEFVEPGTYRVIVQDKSRGVQANDPRSKAFVLTAPELSISSIAPSSMVADGKSSAVLFGNGFTKGTRLYLGQSREYQGNVLFVSPDGKILVFSIPDSVPRGLHRIVLRTSYTTLDGTTSIRVE